MAGREKKVLTTEKKSTHTYTAVLVVVVAAAVKCSSSLHSLRILLSYKRKRTKGSLGSVAAKVGNIRNEQN